MKALERLSVEHEYYCSESNWYSNEASERWANATDFLDSMEDADIDMNMVFRWDVIQNRDNDDNKIGSYYAQVFIMQQRKGRFTPHWIDSITEGEVERFEAYIKKHWDHMQSLWKPLGVCQEGK